MGNDTTPNTGVADNQETDTQYQSDSNEVSARQAADNLNRKRTYDSYQDLDLSLERKLNAAFASHFVNATVTMHSLDTSLANSFNSTFAQVLKHADVAMDGLWTDQMNPVARGAGDDLTGQAPVNPGLASTASLNTVFSNLTAQTGEQVSQVVGLAKAVMQQSQAQHGQIMEMLGKHTDVLKEMIVSFRTATAK